MDELNIEKTLSSEYTSISENMLEIGLDSILEDGFLKDIPAFNTIISLTKIGLNIKDRMFLKKLLVFLYETQKIPVDKREKLIEEINQSDKYKSKVGEKLVFIIDHADEYKKAQMIGKLFCFVLEGSLSYNMFIRCCESINKTFFPDLQWFLNEFHLSFLEGVESDSLLNSGILKISSVEGPNTFGSIKSEIKLDISEVGLCMHKYLGVKHHQIYSLRNVMKNRDKNKW